MKAVCSLYTLKWSIVLRCFPVGMISFVEMRITSWEEDFLCFRMFMAICYILVYHEHSISNPFGVLRSDWLLILPNAAWATLSVNHSVGTIDVRTIGFPIVVVPLS